MKNKLFMFLCIYFYLSWLGVIGLRHGRLAFKGEYPFFVSVLDGLKKFRGSGVLISLDHVLTAASCIAVDYNNNTSEECSVEVLITSGLTTKMNPSDSDETIKAVKCDFHRAYEKNTYDMAIVHLDSSVTNEQVLPINVVSSKLEIFQKEISNLQKNKTVCQAIGWFTPPGDSHGILSMSLRSMEMDLPSVSHCVTVGCSIGIPILCENDLREKGIICANGIGLAKSCSGDRGNPLICNKHLVGMLSTFNNNCRKLSVVTLPIKFIEMAGVRFNVSRYYINHTFVTPAYISVHTNNSDDSSSIDLRFTTRFSLSFIGILITIPYVTI